MKFIDSTTLLIKAGNGGMGCIAFLREKFRPKGGPSGGDGGRGGNIIFKTNSNLITLQDIALKKHYRAYDGSNGSGNKRHGKNGKDIVISIPVGTIVVNADTEQVLKDFTKVNESYIVARGGNGGFGNARFKTQRQTAPRIANDGQQGEEFKINLELKVLADVGLVGFPNSGKSTFISKVSNAKPKIADYPFTTLVPNLGIVKYSEFKSFVMADIPGLISGASSGRGLGSQFLRHIERTKILVYLIEIIDEKIEENFSILQLELQKHNPELIKRPSILLLTKSDLLNNNIEVKTEKIKISSIVKVSSFSGENINKSIELIVNLIQD